MSLLTDFTKGIWKENPVLVLLLGSNLVISLIAGIVPKKVRIPVYIVVIATFVTIVDLLMKAYAPPALYTALGIFIPLIVVNCIVLGRAEAFASKNGPLSSVLDGLGMGLGFTLTLTMLGAAREFLSSGSVFEVKLITAWTTDFLLPSAAPGAFILVGVILALKNYASYRKAVKAGRLYVPPKGLDCRHCNICTAHIDDEK